MSLQSVAGSRAPKAAALLALTLAACGGTTGGNGVVYVSGFDAVGDGHLADDATGLGGDAVGADVLAGLDASTDAAGLTDAPVLADVAQPNDADLTDGSAQDVAVADATMLDADGADVPAVDVVTADAPVLSDSGAPPCKSDVACKATNQVCDIGGGVCVDCNSEADCKSPQVCTAHKCVIEQKCTSSKDCLFVCNKAVGICVECLSNSDCFGGTVCGADFACHVQAKVCSPGSYACTFGGYTPCKADGSGYSSTVTSCADANACTGDTCKGNVSGDPCVHTPITGACDDGNFCTSGETCSLGVCWNGQTVNCDDGDPCTADSCDSTIGCLHDPIPGCGGLTCGQDANNTCKGKCTTDPLCSFGASFCGMQPGICPPDWQVCCP